MLNHTSKRAHYRLWGTERGATLNTLQIGEELNSIQLDISTPNCMTWVIFTLRSQEAISEMVQALSDVHCTMVQDDRDTFSKDCNLVIYKI